MNAHWKAYAEFIKNRGNIEEALIVNAENGAMWASTNPDSFFLREYKATITQEDGNEKEETVNEAENILKLLKGQKPLQGLRINASKKHQITRFFHDDNNGNLPVIYSKIPNGGSCVASAGKCILIGIFNETKLHTSPDCNDTIQGMATYLAKSTWPDKDPGTLAPSGVGLTLDPSDMNWSIFLQKSLISRGHIAEAMFIAMDSGEILASTAEFKLQTYSAEIPQEDGTDRNETVDEWKNVKQLISKSKPSQGLRVNQVKYQIIRSYDDEVSTCYTVLGKKSLGGVAIANSGKVIIIATFDEKKQHQSPNCNEYVAQLAKYFKETLK